MNLKDRYTIPELVKAGKVSVVVLTHLEMTEKFEEFKHLPKMQAYQEVAEVFKVSERTVQRVIRQNTGKQ